MLDAAIGSIVEMSPPSGEEIGEDDEEDYEKQPPDWANFPTNLTHVSLLGMPSRTAWASAKMRPKHWEQ